MYFYLYAIKPNNYQIWQDISQSTFRAGEVIIWKTTEMNSVWWQRKYWSWKNIINHVSCMKLFVSICSLHPKS